MDAAAVWATRRTDGRQCGHLAQRSDLRVPAGANGVWCAFSGREVNGALACRGGGAEADMKESH